MAPPLGMNQEEIENELKQKHRELAALRREIRDTLKSIGSLEREIALLEKQRDRGRVSFAKKKLG